MTIVAPAIVPFFISGGVLALSLLAAMRDVIARTVSNEWCGAIAIGGLMLRVMDGTVLRGLAIAFILLLLLLPCWRYRLIGGGDVKLLSACALAAQPARIGILVFDTALIGAMLGVVYLFARRRVPRPRQLASHSLPARIWRVEQWRLHRGGPLPYAVAIALAFGLALVPGGSA